MTHTPGPWYVVGGTIIGSKTRSFIANTPAADSVTFKEDRDNARLIAAAPDLLEALKDARRFLEHGPEFPYHLLADAEDLQEQIKQAIAKAEGGNDG